MLFFSCSEQARCNTKAERSRISPARAPVPLFSPLRHTHTLARPYAASLSGVRCNLMFCVLKRSHNLIMRLGLLKRQSAVRVRCICARRHAGQASNAATDDTISS